MSMTPGQWRSHGTPGEVMHAVLILSRSLLRQCSLEIGIAWS